ncbi:MAG TPA: hypothetical protein VFI14_00535 [Chryseosolibacter sp.]|nr:hypothetical protein [Chryseosolibacter sp.]
MRRPSRSGLLLAFALCAGMPVAGQNLESIGREKPFTFSGGVSMNQIFYRGNGAQARREPYSYAASGNLSLSIYGWAIPLSFSFSNHHSTFSQPFNQYSLHPSWKWVTAHAGYTSMSFSPYTVNGHIFLGGGIDLAPGRSWKVSALYGRFLKAVEADRSGNSPKTPAFQRYGYGFKASYGTGADFIDAIVFHAADEPESIRSIHDSLGITPEENLVVSLGGGKTLFRHFRLKGEVASSALSKDTRAASAESRVVLARAGFLFKPRVSTSYYKAFKTSFDYQREGWTIGAAWERIDPEYKTLGAYYFNNDLENVTLNLAGGLFQGKVNIAASGGVQHDNLDDAKLSTMRRMVGSLNVSYASGQQFNLSASYSTFQTYTNIRSQFENINQLTPFDNLDTLNFTQISRSASVSGMHSFGAAAKKQTITTNLTWQDAADVHGDARQNSGTQFYNLNMTYAVNFPERKFMFVAAVNGTMNEGVAFHTSTWGPNLSLTKLFLQGKLRTTVSSLFNRTFIDGVAQTASTNVRVNGSVALRQKHRLIVSAVMVSRAPVNENSGTSIREFTGTAGYSYIFGSSH